jgi:hypothetical protein
MSLEASLATVVPEELMPKLDTKRKTRFRVLIEYDLLHPIDYARKVAYYSTHVRAMPEPNRSLEIIASLVVPDRYVIALEKTPYSRPFVAVYDYERSVRWLPELRDFRPSSTWMGVMMQQLEVMFRPSRAMVVQRRRESDGWWHHCYPEDVRGDS